MYNVAVFGRKEDDNEKEKQTHTIHIMSKNTLTTALQNVLKLTFTKKDGTTRHMTCTQNREFLNANAEKLSYTEPASTRTVGKDQAIVWDLVKEGWRTVNVDSVEILETIPCASYIA